MVLGLIRSLLKAFKPKPNPHSLKANFIRETNIVSRWNFGFCLTGKRNLSIKQSYQNSMVIGGTGSGKSSVVLIPSLLTMKGNFVIHDPSGELYKKSAGHLSSKGYQILRLNFTNPNISFGFNPLAYIRSSSEAGKLASLLVRTSLTGTNDQFWQLQAISLLTTIIQSLLKEPPQLRTLKSVQNILKQVLSDEERVYQYMSSHSDEQVRYDYAAFRGYEEKLRTNIVATALSVLTPLNDENIAKVTSVNTWSLSALRKKKVALYVQNPLTEMSYLSSLTSIFFETIWKQLLTALPYKTDHNIFFLIDEASSLYLPSLSVTVANVRKYRAGIMLVLQNYNQLVHLYGEAETDTIASNCITKLYLSGQSLSTSQSLEAILGKYEYKDQDGNRHVRSLMTKSEIRMLSRTSGLLISSNLPPIKASLKPYYKRPHLRYRSEKPIPRTPRHIPHNLIYLNL